MKKFYSRCLLAIGLLYSTFGNAQNGNCSIENTGITVVSSNSLTGNRCQQALNISFMAKTNNSNKKYFYVHIWQNGSYPNVSYSNAPNSTQLGSVLRTIVIEKTNNGWQLSSSYPQNGVAVDPAGIQLKYASVPNTPATEELYKAYQDYIFFELNNVAVTTTGSCGTATFKADIWSSNNANNSSVNCVNKNVPVFACTNVSAPSVLATINCTSAPRSYSVSFDNRNGCKPYFVYYEVIVDQNKNGTIESTDQVVNTGADEDYQVLFPGQFLVSALRPVTGLNQQALMIRSTSFTFGDGGFLELPTEVEVLTNECALLPVKFKSFGATRNSANKQVVDLSWETSQEQNNRGFQVQRKTDGEWKQIAFVFSASDNGNSNTALSYRFKDQNNFAGVTQYRLLQVDLDGKGTYSDVRAIGGGGAASSVTVYPNPAVNGVINLLFADGSPKDVVVSDMSGRFVKQYREVTSNILSVQGLQSGFYTIKITDRKTAMVSVEKVVVK